MSFGCEFMDGVIPPKSVNSGVLVLIHTGNSHRLPNDSVRSVPSLSPSLSPASGRETGIHSPIYRSGRVMLFFEQLNGEWIVSMNPFVLSTNFHP